ncbi:DUF3850 domain-containing protein [Candidatus Parcubacteria bacterium]|nr:DUF3850 domain-containing protein [Candidatus Parcubacteria bacterium]
MPSLHELKILPEFFAEVLAGRKRSEIRRIDDREFAEGDQLKLCEWTGSRYTGRAIVAQITNITQLNDVCTAYAIDPPQLPLAVISFGTRAIVQPATPPATHGEDPATTGDGDDE